jgi:hypothetical protein
MRILFLHGWQSVPGGVKPTFLAHHGHEVFNPKLPDEDFAEAVRIAHAEFEKHRPHAVVGSSRGGAVAMSIDSGDARLVLPCPAWRKWGTARAVKAGTVVLHSRADDVVPFADSEELVRNSGLPASALVEVGDDHRLADPEPLRKMLEACEGINKRPQPDFRCGRGKVPVPKEVTELCWTTWDISGVVAKAAQGWRLVEVWNVSP